MLTATNYKRVTGGAATDIVTGSVRIYQLVVTNASAGSVVINFTKTDGTPIFDVGISAFDTKVLPFIPFISQGGFRLNNAPGVDISVTVFHTTSGV